MEDNEILENENLELEEESSGSGSADPEDSTEIKDALKDAIRAILEESSEEETSEEDTSEEESSEVEEQSEVDYSDILSDIHSELVYQNELLESQIENQNKPITEKSLNDFTVSECLLCFLAAFFVIKCVIKLIDKFTFKI